MTPRGVRIIATGSSESEPQATIKVWHSAKPETGDGLLSIRNAAVLSIVIITGCLIYQILGSDVPRMILNAYVQQSRAQYGKQAVQPGQVSIIRTVRT